MNHNGYNTYEKRGLGSVKIGRYICPSCYEPCEEEREMKQGTKKEYKAWLKTQRATFRAFVREQKRDRRRNQIKLSAMKRAGLLGRGKKSLLEAFLLFIPFFDSR